MKKLNLIFILVLSLCLIVSFQNCGQKLTTKPTNQTSQSSKSSAYYTELISTRYLKSSVNSDIHCGDLNYNVNDISGITQFRVTNLHCWGSDVRLLLGLSKNISNENLAYNLIFNSTETPKLYAQTDGLSTNENSSYAIGKEHICVPAIRGGNYEVYCLGKNLYGQLGDGTTTDNAQFTKVIFPESLTYIKDISAGDYHTCVIASTVTEANRVWCWGRNIFGQLGTGDNMDSSFPIKISIANTLSVNNIESGNNHNCALIRNHSENSNLYNRIYCWGDSTKNQLGNNPTSNSPQLYLSVLNSTNIFEIRSSGNHSCYTEGQTSNYNVVCWGENTSGELGLNATNGTSLGTATIIPNSPSNILIHSSQTICYNNNSPDNRLFCRGLNPHTNLNSIGETLVLSPLNLNNIDFVFDSFTLKNFILGTKKSCYISTVTNQLSSSYQVIDCINRTTSTMSRIKIQ